MMILIFALVGLAIAGAIYAMLQPETNQALDAQEQHKSHSVGMFERYKQVCERLENDAEYLEWLSSAEKAHALYEQRLDELNKEWQRNHPLFRVLTDSARTGLAHQIECALNDGYAISGSISYNPSFGWIQAVMRERNYELPEELRNQAHQEAGFDYRNGQVCHNGACWQVHYERVRLAMETEK